MNPSQTITSALPLNMSRPSTLPMKLRGASLRARNASRVTSFPLLSSSPMLIRPTRGVRTPSASRAYRCPITANCTRCSGLQSMLAPTSSQTEGPLRFGTTAHKAGRSTPSRTPQIILTVVITAPVFPALTTPAARPSRTRVAATRMEESFLRRKAVTGDSCISTTSLAWTISIGSPPARCFTSSDSIASLRPTRMSRAPYSRAARTAPATGFEGAKSPPIASMAIDISTCAPLPDALTGTDLGRRTGRRW